MANGRSENRAGREVAEDAKRAVRRAFEGAALRVAHLRMVMTQDRQARFVFGGASPEGWPYELPAVAVEFYVRMTGDVSPVKVFCAATDDDPMTAVAMGRLALKDCLCQLAELQQVLKAVWEERQALVARQKAGEKVRSHTGACHWEWTGM